MSRTEERTQESTTALERYSLFDRVLHWFVALTFI